MGARETKRAKKVKSLETIKKVSRLFYFKTIKEVFKMISLQEALKNYQSSQRVQKVRKSYRHLKSVNSAEELLKKNRLEGLKRIRKTIETVKRFRELSIEEYLLLKKMVVYVKRNAWLPKSYRRMLRDLEEKVSQEFVWLKN